MSVCSAARGPVTTFRLRDGLEVFLLPRPQSPTASVWVWHRVGSVNEHAGITGVSHWVEHMLFQGSRRFGKGEVDRLIHEVGGSSNAFTDNDFTAYFTTVPWEHLEVPLRIEADRLTGARMARAECERERQVIISEREGNENRPEFKVEEELYALAFRRHPYRWDPLGYPQDMRSMPERRVREYYERFYGPANARLVIAGRFAPGLVRRRVRRLFSNLPRRGEDPTVHDVEPLVDAARRSTISGPGSTPIMRMAWHAPPVHAARAPAALVLSQILGGDTSLFSGQRFGQRAVEHPNSRLYRRVVEPGLAVRVSVEYRPRAYPGLFTVHAQASPGVPLEPVEQAIWAELEQMKRRGPTRAELSLARTMMARGARLAYEGSTRTAFRVGYFATYGGLRLEDRLLDAALGVRPAEVQAEAAQLFGPGRTVTVLYQPVGDGHAY